MCNTIEMSGHQEMLNNLKLCETGLSMKMLNWKAARAFIESKNLSSFELEQHGRTHTL